MLPWAGCVCDLGCNLGMGMPAYSPEGFVACLVSPSLHKEPGPEYQIQWKMPFLMEFPNGFWVVPALELNGSIFNF